MQIINYLFMMILIPGGILHSAQSFPSLSNSSTPITIQNSISTIASNTGSGPINFNQALAMSLTSASTDSERVSLEVLEAKYEAIAIIMND